MSPSAIVLSAAVLGGALGAGVLLLVVAADGRRPGAGEAIVDASSAAATPAARPSRRRGLTGLLAQAGLVSVPPAAFVTVAVLAGVLCAALGAAAIGVPVLALAAGAAGASVPWLAVGWRLRQHRAAASAAWPDVVDQLVAAVRAGIALPEAVAALADTGPEPSRAAFARFGREYRAAGAFADSVDRLKDELADPVGDRILETLKMAREVGGSELVAVLRALAASLREDAAARSELRARQSWVVNAARLGVAAPWLVLALLASRPEGRQAYATATGSAVVIAAAVLSVVAYRVMVAIGRLPEERRWFR